MTMKNLPQDLEDKLLSYLDNKLPGAERTNIETLLEHDTNLQERFKELQTMHSLMKRTKLEQPSLNFTSRLMVQLDQVPATTTRSIRNGIFLVIGVLITVGIAAALISTGTFDDASTMVDLNKLDVNNKFINEELPSFSLDGKLLVQGIIVLNLAIAFVVLDRAVLKPFFQRRMQSTH
jgi:anti-sigma factor RsiW